MIMHGHLGREAHGFAAERGRSSERGGHAAEPEVFRFPCTHHVPGEIAEAAMFVLTLLRKQGRSL
jgi:hypothetical protein